MRPPFHFRQFSVSDNDCGMKLTGDAVILGCLAKPPVSGNILDIGCGCGILSLMMAQQSNSATIHAIDIDEAAVNETQKNFGLSPWKNRLWVSKISIQQFALEKTKCYNHIICNPPYFKNNLSGNDNAKRIAKHGVKLCMDELFQAVIKLMTPSAAFWLIFPEDELKSNLQNALRNNLYPKNIINIVHKKNDKPVRVVVSFIKNALEICDNETLIIKDDHDQNTAQFQELTQDFYL